MPTRPKPWRKASHGGAWYAQWGGIKHRLADASATFAEADKALAKLISAGRAREERAAAGLTTADIFSMFLVASSRAVESDELQLVTVQGYKRFLIPAGKSFGNVLAKELRPHHVIAWLESRTSWGPTTRAHAVASIKRAFSWAFEIGHLDTNPILRLAKPQADHRTAVPTTTEAVDIIRSIDDEAFRDILICIYETGCRPGEAQRLDASMVDLEQATWTVPNKTRRKSKQSHRVVMLTPLAMRITRKWIAKNPSGIVFRNRLGNPWNRHSFACRFRDIRAKLGLGAEAAANAFRHLFITDALEEISIAAVANLVGHTDTTMIMRVYSKLEHRHDHLRSSLESVRGISTELDDVSSERRSSPPPHQAKDTPTQAEQSIDAAASKPSELSPKPRRKKRAEEDPLVSSPKPRKPSRRSR